MMTTMRFAKSARLSSLLFCGVVLEGELIAGRRWSEVVQGVAEMVFGAQKKGGFYLFSDPVTGATLAGFVDFCRFYNLVTQIEPASDNFIESSA